MLRRELQWKVMGIRALPQHLTITGALAVALCLLALLATGSGRAHAQEEDYKPGEVIVKLDPRIVDPTKIDTTIEDINAAYGTTTLDDTLKDRYIYLLKTPDNEDALTFAELLATDPLSTRDRVLYAEANFVAKAPEYLAGDARMRARAISFRKQSSEANNTFATNLNLSSCTRDIKGATVAVLDTGAQLSHPRLEANFRGITRYDYDFVDDDTTPSDERYYRDELGYRVRGQMAGHGTHVAGIVDQVAPGAKIMPLRVLDPEGYGDVYTVARAIAYAQDHEVREVDVINLSLGTPEHSDLLQEMVEEATGAPHNIVVVAAAGNSGIDEVHYPAAGKYGTEETPLINPANDGLLAVTSLDENELKSDFATFGDWVDIAAPGEDIRSTFLRDKYANWSGTSMATPFISGQAALIHAGNNSLTSLDIEVSIRDTADDSIYDPLTHDSQYLLTHSGKLGYGHADVCGSL